MAYTNLQDLRKMRARNKGLNRGLAVSLRAVAVRLEKKGLRNSRARKLPRYRLCVRCCPSDC